METIRIETWMDGTWMNEVAGHPPDEGDLSGEPEAVFDDSFEDEIDDLWAWSYPDPAEEELDMGDDSNPERTDRASDTTPPDDLEEARDAGPEDEYRYAEPGESPRDPEDEDDPTYAAGPTDVFIPVDVYLRRRSVA